MSQYYVKVAAGFPSAQGADAFAEKVNRTIGVYPKHEGLIVAIVLGSHGDGPRIWAKARERGGNVKVEVVAEEN